MKRSPPFLLQQQQQQFQDPLVAAVQRYLGCDAASAVGASMHWRRWICGALPGTFLARRCRRAGFTPFPSASLLLWAALPAVWSVGRTSLWTLLAAWICVGTLAALINSALLGFSLRRLTRLLFQTSPTRTTPSASLPADSLPPTVDFTGTDLFGSAGASYAAALDAVSQYRSGRGKFS